MTIASRGKKTKDGEVHGQSSKRDLKSTKIVGSGQVRQSGSEISIHLQTKSFLRSVRLV
jgi:hypothetical protein